MTENLEGIIERVTFHNPDNGFAVLRVRVEGASEPVTVVGNVTLASAGEQIEAVGNWVNNRDHGRQFQSQELRTITPTTKEGIEKFLGSGAVRGVGPKLAARIVSLYEDRTLDILDNYPEMLAHLRGIGAERARRIRESWQESRQVRKILLFLHAHGIGAARATRIYRTYGEDAIDLIRENPYRLADDIHGIGFKTADDLAAKLGLERNSPHRARAAVRYVLAQFSTQGHVGCPESEVIEGTDQLISIGYQIVQDAIQFEIGEDRLVRETHAGDPWLFLTPLYRAEVGLAESVHRLLENPLPLPISTQQIETQLEDVEETLGIELADAQRDAIHLALSNRLTVITGGPGVGKTTLVRSLLEIAEQNELECVLAAPTGRAARRLTETSGRPASTVHRLLGYDPARGGATHNRDNPLEGDLFVLDEVSMVDVLLGNRFLAAIPEDASVVLVGDVDQLPSVGPGTVLGDLIQSGVVPSVRLTKIFRQAESSQIVTAAYAVHQGQLPPLKPPKSDLSDFYFTPCEDPESVRQMIVRLITERIPERFGLDPRQDVQVLTPMNRTPLGARALNELLQTTLNPASKTKAEAERFGQTFRVGDRVLQTVNNYNRGVFNGDLGTITTIDTVEQEVIVRFDDGDIPYDFAALDELQLAYALTIHKSQGSEYPAVIIPVHTQHFVMLQRNLLYTGITRGKQLVVLVGSQKALEIAVSRQNTNERHSALCARIRTR
ncbi:SF1B family DNA helicase RecD2 [Thalassoroseus pseudoceratinae]|uniref:SF1B family DNA helicase RecD2 n=1 Tax=Thalassoroseus pseudoceratinae TaxID=2713176 RepID=UPI00141DABE5|nr:ATP-dependent RecD-like DNA helicase [Thalassoroseus pseudoceratinae]